MVVVTDTESSRGGLTKRRSSLAIDRGGQVSFAVIAVAILVASGMTGAYLAKKEIDKYEDKKDEQVVNAMEAAIGDVAQELALYAASKAHAVVSNWDEFPVNETEISGAFSDGVKEFIEASFPRAEGKFTVQLRNWTGCLFFVEKQTMDLVQSDRTTTDEIDMNGTKMQYDRLDPASVELLDQRTASPYYVAVGNFTVEVSAKNLQISRTASFERPVVSALPLLESKLRAFESSSEGEYADLGKLVEYMLVTLCQLRVLEGYGQPMYSAGMDTSGILTEQDVYNAVAVALLIEQAKLFRAVDDEFADAVGNLCSPSSPGLSALLGSKGRYLDPAELFLWFLGRTDARVDSTMILAQSIYGIADQFAVKIMEYMGWLGAADFATDYAGLVTDTAESVISFFTGEDKSVASVTSWISKSIEATGEDPFTYCTFYASPIDFYLRVPERQYFVQNAAGDLFPVWVGNVSAAVDVPTYRALSDESWGDFYPRWKNCQSDFRGCLSDFVARLAFDIASCGHVDSGDLVVDPTDGKDLFTQMSLHSGSVSITLDPATISAIGRDMPLFSSQYRLAQEFRSFVTSNWERLLNQGEMYDAMCLDLAHELAASSRYAYIPDLVVPAEQQLLDIIAGDIRGDPGWGVGSQALSVLRTGFEMRLRMLADAVNSSVCMIDDVFAGPLVDSMARFLLMGCDGFPGLKKALEKGLEEFSKAVIAQRDLSGNPVAVYIDLANPFEFWDGDRTVAQNSGSVLRESIMVRIPSGLPPLQIVPYDPATGYDSIMQLFPVDDIMVQVKRPWDFGQDRSEYPNIHLTSIQNCSATPYSTQWTVSVVGLLEVNASVASSGIQSLVSPGQVTSGRAIRLNFSVPVVVHSAWPLQGVHYNPTNTLLSDSIDAAKKFTHMVWDKIEPYVGWIKDGLERLYRFLVNAFETFSSFATRVIKAISQALQSIVENLQEFVQQIANSVLAKAVKAFIDVTGRIELRVSLHGLLIIIQTNLPDLLYRHGTDMLRIIVCSDRLGPTLSFGIRVARFSDGSYDVLANGTVAVRDIKLDVLFDPLMKVMRRLVEAHCTGDSWAMDILVPEVEPYCQARVSTADIPGIGALLSNIPLPALGLTASVEAGMTLKFCPPFPSDVVVNEFESNPSGSDSGNEWVELYNPLSKPKCVDGWTIATMHGRNEAMPIHGTIAANGLATFRFPETSLDNGDDEDPFTDGDAIILLDAGGVPVDVTPALRDTANDERTNQRNWDGGPRWVFKPGTPGGSNGIPIIIATSDFIVKALFQSFKDAFVETQLQEVSASLDFLIMFSKRVLRNFIDNLLSIISEVIQDVAFYFEVTVNDATASAGAGIRFSFIISGEAIEDLVRWVIQTLATYVVNLGRPSNPITYPAFPKSFFSGLYLSVKAIFFVGMPKMIRALGAIGDLHQRFTLAIAVSPNIPAIGKLVGKSWGTWEVSFGACLERVPRTFAVGFMTNDRVGDYIDFWMLKGRLYAR